jgi:hypothetical protein
MGSTWLFRFCILSLGLLAACQKPDTAVDSDKNTRLVWLAPQSPCEASDPGFGHPTCFVRRKREAVAVLKVPLRYASDAPAEINGGFGLSEVIFEADGVLTKGTPGRFDEWLEKLNAIYKRGAAKTNEEPFVLTGLDWGWRQQFDEDGHASAYRAMGGEKDTKSFGENANYVQTESPAEGFTAYAIKACVGYHLVVSSTKGRVAPEHPCDTVTRYYLPKDDPKTYVFCNAPFIGDGVINHGLYCKMNSHFTLMHVNGVPFNIYFRYSPLWPDLQSGQWKRMNQRFEAWVKSIDVTQLELSRIKQ